MIDAKHELEEKILKRLQALEEKIAQDKPETKAEFRIRCLCAIINDLVGRNDQGIGFLATYWDEETKVMLGFCRETLTRQGETT